MFVGKLDKWEDHYSSLFSYWIERLNDVKSRGDWEKIAEVAAEVNNAAQAMSVLKFVQEKKDGS
jgi:flagellin-specific chaperone FliS